MATQAVVGRLVGKVVFVTGAAQGIGRATALVSERARILSMVHAGEYRDLARHINDLYWWAFTDSDSADQCMHELVKTSCVFSWVSMWLCSVAVRRGQR